jgi:hypothetical protein
MFFPTMAVDGRHRPIIPTSAFFEFFRIDYEASQRTIGITPSGPLPQ